MAGRRRVVFVKAPDAAPVAPAPVRVPIAPVLFVKSETPRPYLLPDPFEGHDFSKAKSPGQFDIVMRAVHDGYLTLDDGGRAADAWTCGRPVPEDMRMVVVAGSQ